MDLTRASNVGKEELSEMRKKGWEQSAVVELELGVGEGTVFVADAKAFALTVNAVMLHGNSKTIPPWDSQRVKGKEERNKRVTPTHAKS